MIVHLIVDPLILMFTVEIVYNSSFILACNIIENLLYIELKFFYRRFSIMLDAKIALEN